MTAAVPHPVSGRVSCMTELWVKNGHDLVNCTVALGDGRFSRVRNENKSKEIVILKFQT